MFEDLDLYQQSSGEKPHLDELLESTATSFLCRLQDSDCLSKVKNLYSTVPSGYFDAPDDIKNP